jgi:hypothetical protein
MKKRIESLEKSAKEEQYDGSIVQTYKYKKKLCNERQKEYIKSKELYEQLRKERNSIYNERITRF